MHRITMAIIHLFGPWRLEEFQSFLASSRRQVEGNKKARGPEGPMPKEVEMRVLKVIRGEVWQGEGGTSSGSDD